MRKLIRRLPMLHPGMHALSGERAMEALRSRDRDYVVADGPTKEVSGARSVGRMIFNP